MNINIHHHYNDIEYKEIKEELFSINNKLNKIMANITELTQKVDDLQVSLDAEQEQIRLAIEALNQAIADLQLLVVEGGTPEQRQALADKLDAIKGDLENTIP